MAFALAIIGEKTRADLNCIRDIRNAFAHAKVPLDFTHPLVREELKRVKIPKFRKKVHRIIAKAIDPQASYVSLCFTSSLFLMKKVTAYWRGKSKRMDKVKMSPLASFFASYAPKGNRSTLRSLLPSQTGDPTPPRHRGLLDDLTQLVSKTGNKPDK